MVVLCQLLAFFPLSKKETLIFFLKGSFLPFQLFLLQMLEEWLLASKKTWHKRDGPNENEPLSRSLQKGFI